MNYINFNGTFLPDGYPIAGADNRGLRYGDGLFETMKYKNGRIILSDEHLERLWNGLANFQFELPKLFTKDYLINEVLQLVEKNKHNPARIRLAITRGDGGLYDPVNHQPNFIIQSWPLLNIQAELNSNGLQLCIYRDALKSCDQFSNIKHNNYLPYLMGAMAAKKQHCTDAVILNQHLRVSDSTIANIFIIKDNTVHTPSLSEGCIAGIMRQYLLKQLPLQGFQVTEKEISEDMLMNADEVFLSNSIFNIRWVAGIDDKKYQNDYIKNIFNTLTKTNDGVFC